MSSEQQVFVWAFLPGETVPMLCGRLNVNTTPAGLTVASFVYGRKYLADKFAPALDPIRLPKRPAVFETSGQVAGEPDIFGVIADSLPDSWGRYVINRRYGEQLFPTGYLLRASEDAVGNLCFSCGLEAPPVLAPPTRRELLDEAWAVIAGLESGKPISAALLDRVRPNTAMGGARPKLTVADDQAQWLAKFPSGKDDKRFSQAKAEAAMLDLAARCGIEAAHAELQPVRGVDGAPAGEVLLVRRFDRSLALDGKGWVRDAFVSARTIAQSEAGTRVAQYMASYTQVAEQLQRWSLRPVEDRRELFRRLVFNCCISNTDDHDRNHGLLADAEGHLFRLSPAFDMVPRVHGTRVRRQAMAFGDSGSEATVANLISAAPAFSLTVADASEVIEDVQRCVQENWLQCLLERGMTRDEAQVLAPCFGPLPPEAQQQAVPERRPGLRF